MTVEPKPGAARVFISYSRRDLDGAEALREGLRVAGFDPYLDIHDIGPGEKWKARLSQLIAGAEKLVFLISPDSVASDICEWEIDHAERLGKSVLPVVVRDTDHQDIPGRLSEINFIFLRTPEERRDGMERLIKALSTDLEWEREKTRVNDLAETWDGSGRPSRLLTWREDAIRALEQWRDSHPATSPPPTDTQRAYISQSRQRFSRRQKWIRGGLASVAALTTAAALLANEARVAAGVAALEAQLNAEAARLVDAAGRRDGDAALADAVWAYAIAERELGEAPYTVWNALRVAHQKSRLTARRPSPIEPSDFEPIGGGGVAAITHGGELALLDRSFSEKSRQRLIRSADTEFRLRFTTSRRVIAVREESGARFVGLDGGPLYEGRVFRADAPEAIDAGENCVVRARDAKILIEKRSSGEPTAPEALQTARSPDIGAPRLVRVNNACDAVLIVGAKGDALWAWLDGDGAWSSVTLNGEPAESWSASPDLAILASHTSGSELYVFRDRSPDWSLVTIIDASLNRPGSIERVRITQDGRLLTKLLRSDAVYDIEGRVLIQPEQFLAVSTASYFVETEQLAIWDRTTQGYSLYDARRHRNVQTLLPDVALPANNAIKYLNLCGGRRFYAADGDGNILKYQWGDKGEFTAAANFKTPSFVRRVDCRAGVDIAYGDGWRLALEEGASVQPSDAFSYFIGASEYILGDGRKFQRDGNDVVFIGADGNALDRMTALALDIDDFREMTFDPLLGEAIVLGSKVKDGVRLGAARFVRAEPGGLLRVVGRVDLPGFDFATYGVSLGEGRYAFVGLPGVLALYDRNAQAVRSTTLGIAGFPSRIAPLGQDLFAVTSFEGDVQIWSSDGARLSPSPADGGRSMGLSLATSGRLPGDVVFSRGNREVLLFSLAGETLKRLACEQLAGLRDMSLEAVNGCGVMGRASPWLRRFQPVYSFSARD